MSNEALSEDTIQITLQLDEPGGPKNEACAMGSSKQRNLKWIRLYEILGMDIPSLTMGILIMP